MADCHLTSWGFSGSLELAVPLPRIVMERLNISHTHDGGSGDV